MPKATSTRNLEALGNANDFLSIAKSAFSTSNSMPDIATFTESPKYLGKRLYPRQRTMLRLIFLETENMEAYDIKVINEWANNFYRREYRAGVSPDVWERVEYLKEKGHPHFREVPNISGRRSGKNHIGAIMAAYKNWELIQLDDPQSHYEIDRGKNLYLNVSANNLDQAKEHQFGDIANTILESECFQPYIATAKNTVVTLRTPADFRRIAELNRRGLDIDREIASIVNRPIANNASTGRGAAAFMHVFDEFAHVLSGSGIASNQSGEGVYTAFEPALDQFGKHALIYIPTSPFTKVGQAYSLYQSALQKNADGSPAYPDMLVIQLPSWEPYLDYDDPKVTKGRPFSNAPQIYDEKMESLKRRDPYVFKVERLSQWAEVIDSFLSVNIVEDMFKPFLDANGERRSLSEVEKGKLKFSYRGHADPASSKQGGSNFAAMIGHTEQIPDENDQLWQHVIIDWMKVWTPQDYESYEIDYKDLENELADAILSFPTLRLFTYDQFGSFVTVSQMQDKLKKKRSATKVEEIHFTKQYKDRMKDTLRASLGMGWVKSYRDNFGLDGASLLELELKFLQNNNGRIEPPKVGPVRTDDLVDCLGVICESLLGEQYRMMQKREELGNSRSLVGQQIQRDGSGMSASSVRQRLRSANSVGRMGQQVKRGRP